MARTKRRKSQPGRYGVIDRMFFAHPRSLEMSWAGHGAGALKVGFQLIGAGFAALIHAAIPGLLADTASKTVVKVHDHIKKLNSKRSADG